VRSVRGNYFRIVESRGSYKKANPSSGGRKWIRVVLVQTVGVTWVLVEDGLGYFLISEVAAIVEVGLGLGWLARVDCLLVGYSSHHASDEHERYHGCQLHRRRSHPDKLSTASGTQAIILRYG
jgi:hypothetical protein